MTTNGSRTPSAMQFFWLAHGLLLLTIYGSLIPLRYEPMPREQAIQRFRDIEWHDPRLTAARGDWVVNTLQYATVSFCYMGAFCLDRRWVFGLLNALLVLPAGCALAVAMEFLQIYFPPRTVALNDIVVECLGVCLGTVAWLLAGQRLTDWLRRFWQLKGLSGLAAQTLPLYLGLILVTSLMPFDVVLGRAELAEKFREGRVQLVPFGSLAPLDFHSVLNLLRPIPVFLPVGALLALVPRFAAWDGRTVLRVGLVGTGLVQLLRVVIYTRYSDVTNVLTGTAAILLGWWLVHALRDPLTAQRHGLVGVYAFSERLREGLTGWGPGRWVFLALAWSVLLMILSWQPFDFSTDPHRFLESDADQSDEHTAHFGLRRMTWAPFVDYYWGSRYQALDQFVWRTLSFAPVGVLLALAFGRRERLGACAAILVGMALAAVVEFGKYFVPERHPSTTSWLIQTFAAWLGYKLARHVVHALTSAAGFYQENQYVPPGGAASVKPAPAASFLGRFPRRAGQGQVSASSGFTFADPTQRGQGQSNPFAAWFDARPYWFQITLIVVGALVLAIGLVMLLRVLGLL